MADISYLDGKRTCVVFVKEVPDAPGKAQVQCFHGRADTGDGKLTVFDRNGAKFTVPNSALNNILPSDGTALLKDAEYFVMVKVHPDIDFIGNGVDDVVVDSD